MSNNILNTKLSIDNKIFDFYPVKNQVIYNLYKKAEKAYWTEEEIILSNDLNNWKNVLNDNERHFISHILAFFYQSDQVVTINLKDRFSKDVETLPNDLKIYVQHFYEFQIMIENIHTQVYGRILHTYISNEEEKDYYKNSISTIPCIRKKAQWATKWIDDKNTSFATRLIAFAILEGIFFSGSFCAIFWLKERDNDNQNLLPGLFQSNAFISRDEALHTEFAVTLYNLLKKRNDFELHCTNEIIIKMIQDAVDIESEFITSSIKCDMIGMNPKLMIQYIQHVSDVLLQNLDIEPHFKVDNPFKFMINLGLINKANFFDVKDTNYAKAEIGNDITLDLDF